jgi:hypothetical protein
MLSSVLTNDFYARKIHPGASQKLLIKIGRLNSLIMGVFTIGLAVLLQYIRGMNLFDIMVKAYTAFAPAIMAPLLGGILFRRLNSKGALCGIIAGFISGSVLLVLNMVLVGIFREQFVTNPRVNYWLNQGWSSTSILLNFSITTLGLWLGSTFGKISGDERRGTEEFFSQLATPYETGTAVPVSSPFPVIGIVVAIMGTGMAFVALAVKIIYNRPGWFMLDMIAAVILLVLGAVMWLVSKKHASVRGKS